jgi:BA14K-like protein
MFWRIAMQLKLVIAAVVGCALVLAAAPANARWGYHHHGWGWGAGAAGSAAGALLGSTLARPYYCGPPAYAYEPEPGYVEGDAEAYCEQRFRSYDPASGTYLGYDGRRHPCP